MPWLEAPATGRQYVQTRPVVEPARHLADGTLEVAGGDERQVGLAEVARFEAAPRLGHPEVGAQSGRLTVNGLEPTEQLVRRDHQEVRTSVVKANQD